MRIPKVGDIVLFRNHSGNDCPSFVLKVKGHSGTEGNAYLDLYVFSAEGAKVEWGVPKDEQNYGYSQAWRWGECEPISMEDLDDER